MCYSVEIADICLKSPNISTMSVKCNIYTYSCAEFTRISHESHMHRLLVTTTNQSPLRSIISETRKDKQPLIIEYVPTFHIACIGLSRSLVLCDWPITHVGVTFVCAPCIKHDQHNAHLRIRELYCKTTKHDTCIIYSNGFPLDISMLISILAMSKAQESFHSEAMSLFPHNFCELIMLQAHVYYKWIQLRHFTEI